MDLVVNGIRGVCQLSSSVTCCCMQVGIVCACWHCNEEVTVHKKHGCMLLPFYWAIDLSQRDLEDKAIMYGFCGEWSAHGDRQVDRYGQCSTIPGQLCRRTHIKPSHYIETHSQQIHTTFHLQPSVLEQPFLNTWPCVCMCMRVLVD